MKQNCSTCRHFWAPSHDGMQLGCNADAEEDYDYDGDKDMGINSWIDRHGTLLPLRPGCARLTTTEPCPGWGEKSAPDTMSSARPLGRVQVFSSANMTAARLKIAFEAAEVQPHKFVSPSILDPFYGDHEEHDRLTAAFVEIYALDQEVMRRAALIFERHGLGGEDFLCDVRFSMPAKEAL